MKAVAPTVPDVPDERTLIEQFAVLGKKAIAQPVVERLAAVARLRQQAGELR
jgi:hypothetical protein